jgi:DNA-binding NarL/FixJ family response regulator
VSVSSFGSGDNGGLEHHVSAILRKLGVDKLGVESRLEVRAAAAAHGLRAPD